MLSIGLRPDDFKVWLTRFRNISLSSKTKGVNNLLKFEDWIFLLKQAGITRIDQIGKKSYQYQLSRIGDVGDYKVGNCRYILTSDNLLERKENGGNDRISIFQKDYQAKKYRILSPSGETFEGTDVSEFCVLKDLAPTMMHRVLRGERNHHKGWKGQYIE